MWSTAANRLVVMVLTLCALGWGGTAAAAKVETEAGVVAKLYKDFAWQAIGGQTDLFGNVLANQSRSTLEKYFTPSLADLLVKDAACQVKYQGICNLEVDLLFDSQDPRVTDLQVATIAPGRVSVAFKDPANDETTKIEFVVAQVAGKWKIADIIYKRDGWSLKKVLSNKIP
ncbi:MAG: DUF3828 domain-containing protein [Janthinobacterium lividum]